MDGFKNKINRSIQLQLSFGLCISIVFVIGLALIASYLSVLNEAEEIQDDALEQISSLVKNHSITPEFNESKNSETKVILHYINEGLIPEDGDIAKHIKELNNLQFGFHTLSLEDRNYRLLIQSLPNKKKFVVAQQTDLLNDVVESSLLSTLIPMVLLIPVLIFFTIFIIRKAFNPIILLSSNIDRREVEDMSPLPLFNVPEEFSPFISAINRLLNRSSKSIEIQKRFIADAAHELRSPLTAISLQTERLTDCKMSDQARERLITLRLGIERNRQLLEQLLSLARAQNVLQNTPGSVSTISLFATVLETLMPLAESKNIDIEVSLGEEELLYVDESHLSCILKNLIDNAIKYTPKDGKILLTVNKLNGYFVFEVEDSGIGISESNLARVFDPFYRELGNNTHGSGLGLSIAKTLSEKLGCIINLSKSNKFSSGLKVTLFLPCH